jgi:hypothetical protein
LKAPHFKEIYPKLENYYGTKFNIPIDALMSSILFSMEMLDIRAKINRSSDLDVSGRKGDLVFNICQKVAEKIYLSGVGAREYLSEVMSCFEDANISVDWQAFKHPNYIQNRKFDFLPGLSCLDLLFFNGLERGRLVFWQNVNSL